MRCSPKPQLLESRTLTTTALEFQSLSVRYHCTLRKGNGGSEAVVLKSPLRCCSQHIMEELIG